jgi:hypothetical protein
MAFPRLDIVDTDETTVLWSFNDQAGTVNPNSVKAKLGPVDFRVGTQITTAEYLAAGGQISGYRDPIATATLTFYPAAATADARTTGLGVLNKLLERGGVMIWQPTSGSPLRYIDFLASPRVSVYQGQHIANLASVDEGISLEFLMQPYLRGAETTTTGVVVENDPATSSKVRVYPVTASGDLPTPGRVRVQMDSGATVERVLIAHRAQGAEAASIMSDYLSETGFAQVEANGRGWTRTLGTDTTAVSSSGASPGSGTAAASTTFATNLGLVERVKLTRTTLMDSLRGDWDVWARIKPHAADDYHVQMIWSPAATGEAAFAGDVVPLDMETATAFGWIEKNLGTIHIPPRGVALGGLQIRLLASAVGGQDLDWDLIWLVPAEPQGTVVVPAEATAKTLGKALTSPPDEITADPTWVAGAVVGNTIQLNANLEAAGWGPNTGTALAVGRHHFTFRWHWDGAGAKNLKVRIANITDNTEAVAQTISFATNESREVTLRFDAASAKFYQPQIGFTSYAGSGKVTVRSISHLFLPSLTSGVSLRTEPGPRYSIDRLDSSANLEGYLGIEGAIPVMLSPGLNHLMIRCDEIVLTGSTENENKLTRTPTVTVAYSPRYAL